MTPKEKAKELVNKFRQWSSIRPKLVDRDDVKKVTLDDFYLDETDSAKQCALICIEIEIEEHKKYLKFEDVVRDFAKMQIMFLEKVKQEIEKL